MSNIKGRVINKVQGFYYVDVDGKVFESRLRGTLKRTDRKENCVVGDIVEITEENFITEVYPRQNLLLRPVVANIDHLVIQFAALNPVIDYERLNILILHSLYNNISPIVVINKIDLITEEERKEIEAKLYYLKDIGVELLFISQEKRIGLEKLEELLKDKVNAFGGPSGVGKSSIINMLQNVRELQTGETSKRLKRGKHTTRDSNLMVMKNGGFIIDTPGFSSVEFPEIKNMDELQKLFPEFEKNTTGCKYSNCIHINEPSCGVKSLLETGELSQYRYDFYKKIYETLKNERWNKYDK
ncbi:MAG: ribosome small subunit-dependent GTPase A [Fusobacteriaceae bacterium]